jgi:hypothetical protein
VVKAEPVDSVGVFSPSTARVSCLVATESQSFLVCFYILQLLSFVSMILLFLH